MKIAIIFKICTPEKKIGYVIIFYLNYLIFVRNIRFWKLPVN